MAICFSKQKIKMSDPEKEELPVFTVNQLIQPEILSTNDLQIILKDRCIHIRKMHTKSREDLLALIHRVAVPLASRETCKTPIDDEPAKEKKTLNNCINFSNKKIKLSKSGDGASTCRQLPTTSKGSHDKVSKITLKRSAPSSESKRSSEPETPPAKKNKTKITWP